MLLHFLFQSSCLMATFVYPRNTCLGVNIIGSYKIDLYSVFSKALLFSSFIFKYFAHFLFQDWSYLLFSPQIFPCLCPDSLIDTIFHGPNAFKFVTVQFCKRNKDSTCICTVFHWCAVAEKVWRAKQPDFGITGFRHPWIWCDRKFCINRTENWADIETGQWGWLCQLKTTREG